MFNQVSISRLYISPTVRCTDSRWKLELNTLPKVKSLDKFKKTPLFFSQALEKHCTSCLERGKYNCLVSTYMFFRYYKKNLISYSENKLHSQMIIDGCLYNLCIQNRSKLYIFQRFIYLGHHAPPLKHLAILKAQK